MCAIVFGCTSIWLNVNQLRYLPKLKLKRKQKLILDVHCEYIERMAIVPEQQFRELDRIQAVKLNPEAAEREIFLSLSSDYNLLVEIKKFSGFFTIVGIRVCFFFFISFLNTLYFASRIGNLNRKMEQLFNTVKKELFFFLLSLYWTLNITNDA